MPITQHFDRLLFGATIALTAVGLAVMGSASWVLATERYERSASYFVTWQGATAVVGLFAMLVVMHLKTEVVLRPKVVATFLGISRLSSASQAAGATAILLTGFFFLGQIFVLGAVITRVYAKNYGAGIITTHENENNSGVN